jgi:adenine-specific DNA-methyltransferase
MWAPRLLPRSSETEARYTNPDNDPRGVWMSGAIQARNYYSKGSYEVTSPSGKKFINPKGTYWRFSYERFLELNRDNRIWWGSSGDNVPRLKRFLSEVKGGVVPQTLWKFEDVGHTQEAKEELLEFVEFENTENVLNSVKPTRLLRHMLRIGTEPFGSDLVVDFFAGSGPMGHAVLAQNADDGGDRRFLLTQLPEPLPRAEQHITTIADLAKSRLRNVARKTKETTPMFAGDLGFRVFKLDSSNIRVWEPDRDDLDKTLLESVEHLRPGRTETDVLYELLLKLGLDLCVPIDTRILGGKNVHSVGGGVLMACLAEKVERDEAEALAQGIVEWHKALSPAGDTTCVFRDSAFADDVAKTNLAAILEQSGIANVRSL